MTITITHLQRTWTLISNNSPNSETVPSIERDPRERNQSTQFSGCIPSVPVVLEEQGKENTFTHETVQKVSVRMIPPKPEKCIACGDSLHTSQVQRDQRIWENAQLLLTQRLRWFQKVERQTFPTWEESYLGNIRTLLLTLQSKKMMAYLFNRIPLSLCLNLTSWMRHSLCFSDLSFSNSSRDKESFVNELCKEP